MIRAFYGGVVAEVEITKTHRHHMDHCIEYLRHSILCAADGTLEPTFAVPELNTKGVDSNFTHVCNNWENLQDWAVEHRGNDAIGGLSLDDLGEEIP
jgi:hypothetical protein